MPRGERQRRRRASVFPRTRWDLSFQDRRWPKDSNVGAAKTDSTEDGRRRMIIALAGNMGVGKDTIATVLADTHGFAQTAFAKALKDVAQTIFGYEHATLWGPSIYRNAVDPRSALDEFWNTVEETLEEDETLDDQIVRLFPVDLQEKARDLLTQVVLEDCAGQRGTLTPRYVLQRLGTEWGRTVWPEVWLHAVKNTIERGNKLAWVITDCRFANEAQFVKETIKGHVVWVEASTRIVKDTKHAHASEPTLKDLEPWVEKVFDNNGTFEQVPEKVDDLLMGLGW